MVSAPSQMVAHRVAELQFIDSKIHKAWNLHPQRKRKFPVRAINGEFRPIRNTMKIVRTNNTPRSGGEPEVHGETTMRPIPGC